MEATKTNRIARYLEHEVEIGATETVEDVQRNLSEIFPEVSHCKYTQDTQGNITFELVAGTKG